MVAVIVVVVVALVLLSAAVVTAVRMSGRAKRHGGVAGEPSAPPIPRQPRPPAGLLDALRSRAKQESVTEPDGLIALLRDEVVALLAGDAGDRALHMLADEPNVWMFVGVNGVGKTTTIGKLASQRVADGHRVVLAAADTFRAAAADQLELWAQRTGGEIVRGQEGADPGSIEFDAMAAANSRNADLVLVDTAGRLHTKTNLMEELKKLRRIVDRTPGACTEVLL